MRLLYRVVKTSEAPEDIKRAFEYPVFDAAKAAETVLDPESPEEAEETESDDELDREREEEERQWRQRMDEMMLEAERHLEDARREAEQIKSDAYEEGFSQGQTAGYEAGFQEGESEGYLGIGKRRMTWKRCLRPTS